MNVFRLVGDLCHLAAIIILLMKIWKSRSVAGLSGKSQILFAVVFVTRYLDLVTNFVSPYNTAMKVFFISSSLATIFLIYNKFKATYDGNHDSFRMEFLLLPCVLLAVVVNHEFTPMEILWTFSIYVEAVAILPQLFMISKTGEAETITSHYLFALGSYRALYIFNWLYRFYYENSFDIIAVVAGIVQTVLYMDFFYLYITKGVKHFQIVVQVQLALVYFVSVTFWNFEQLRTWKHQLSAVSFSDLAPHLVNLTSALFENKNAEPDVTDYTLTSAVDYLENLSNTSTTNISVNLTAQLSEKNSSISNY